jgi:acyl-CoA thioesterase II
MQLSFVAGGLPERTIEFEVAVLKESNGFSARSVRGLQSGFGIVCDANVTFVTAMESPACQALPAADCEPDLDPQGCAPPESAQSSIVFEAERMLGYLFQSHGAIEFQAPRAEDFVSGSRDGDHRVRFWIKLRQKLGESAALHTAVFAYLSDYWINFAACTARVQTMSERGQRLHVASLNQMIWFHAPLRADDWLLFDCVTPSVARGRGLAVARVNSRAGVLVATAMQECLLLPSTSRE